MFQMKYCGVIVCAYTSAICNAKPCNGMFTICTMLLCLNIAVPYITYELFYYVGTILTIDYYNHSVVFLLCISRLLHQPQTTTLLDEYHNT